MYNLTHEVTKFCTWTASYRLWQSMAFWPKGTIFVSVVDPGVGTPRKACVAKTSNGYYVVTPDNGSLTLVKEKFGIDEVREIDETRNRLVGAGTEDVAIFHGRDLFAYCGGKLAAGLIDFEGVGPAYSVDEIICNPLPEAKITEGRARGLRRDDLPELRLRGHQHQLPAVRRGGLPARRYGQHPGQARRGGQVRGQGALPPLLRLRRQGEPIIYNNELNNLDLSLNEVSMGETYGISYGPDWTISIWK